MNVNKKCVRCLVLSNHKNYGLIICTGLAKFDVLIEKHGNYNRWKNGLYVLYLFTE